MYFENCKLSDKLYNRFLLLPITALHVLSLFIIIYSKRTKKKCFKCRRRLVAAPKHKKVSVYFVALRIGL